VARNIIDIDELVMPRAHQHQVLERLRQQWRPLGIAARPVGAVSDNVSDKAESPILAAGDEVAD
jgi:hypothetical protein